MLANQRWQGPAEGLTQSGSQQTWQSQMITDRINEQMIESVEPDAANSLLYPEYIFTLHKGY